jgi:endoglucanase
MIWSIYYSLSAFKGMNLPNTMQGKRCLLSLIIFSVFQINSVDAATNCNPSSWPLWETFKSRFIELDGRVVAGTAPQFQSFSEGQSYAMIFALIDNDPKTFDKLWQCSVKNLMANDVKSRLPSWTWGKAEDGTWKVLDENSASDADLWYAYILLEAGRLWGRKDYISAANSILALTEQKSLVNIPGFGKTLLPGPYGFTVPPDEWHLNPSYFPIPLLRRLALHSNEALWSEIANTSAKMISLVSPKGFAPDFVHYRTNSDSSGNFITVPGKTDIGSYDAIRVYTWAGMTPLDDPLSKPILKSLSGMQKILIEKKIPPEKINTINGESSGIGLLGFSAALLPYLKASNEDGLLQSQLQRAQLVQHTKEPLYYDYVLGLFGLGWIENRYQFSKNGHINLTWNSSCNRKIN